MWFQRQIHCAGIEHQLGGYVPFTPLTMLPVPRWLRFHRNAPKTDLACVGNDSAGGSIVVLARLSRLGILEVAVLALPAHRALSGNFRFGQNYILILFLARRQWKALAGFVGAVAARGLLAVGMFGWDGVWFSATTVMVRAIDGSVIDPYNPAARR